MLCDDVLCDDMLCDDMLCDDMLCDDMLRDVECKRSRTGRGIGRKDTLDGETLLRR
jgi:hypothetical protein